MKREELRYFNQLEPDVIEHKYYAAAIGVVLGVNVETEEYLELVSLIRD